MRRKFSIKSFFIFTFCCLIFFSSCSSKKDVFQTIDEYTTKGTSGSLCFMGSWIHCGTEAYGDGKIHFQRGSILDETFSLELSKNYKEDGIYFVYKDYENLENNNPFIETPNIQFTTKGYIYPEEYNANQEISFFTTVPSDYEQDIINLFEMFLRTLNEKILRPNDLTLNDFGYITH